MSHYRITVVMPVYNADQYLRQSISSIVNQTIGFKDTVQLILVNDGSTDKSRELLEEYKAKYPSNIKVIDQPNGGTSSARNTGFSLVDTEYVTFFDSDDVWSRNAFSEGIKFLDAHPATDIVASKIKFFDTDISSHPSNYKFNSTRIVDVTKEPDMPLMHLPTCFLRTTSIGEKLFDTRVEISEDAKMLLDLLSIKKTYGVLAKTTYYYRKRGSGSAIDGKFVKTSFYKETLEYVFDYLVEKWSVSTGVLMLFMQYTLLSDIIWRLNQASQIVLNKQEEAEYKNHIQKLINLIDDKVILSKKGLSLIDKRCVLKVKYSQLEGRFSIRGNDIYFDNLVFSQLTDIKVVIDFITNQPNNCIEIEGYVENIPDELLPLLKVNNGSEMHDATPQLRAQREYSFLGDALYSGAAFKVKLDLLNTNKIEFHLGEQVSPLKIQTNRYSGMSRLSCSYTQRGDYLLKKMPTYISVTHKNYFKKVMYEVIYLGRLLTNWRLEEAGRQLYKLFGKNLYFLSPKQKIFELAKPFLVIAEAIVMIPRAISLRIAYHIAKLIKKREIWIISDRNMAAGDNGEALFEYIHQLNDDTKDVYFELSHRSNDYTRVSQYGTVLDPKSLKFKLKFLLADKIISSHADIEVTNPFIRQIDHFIDLYNFDFIFLQHGVTKDDLSSWLNRFEKNIELFIVSGRSEYQSILDYPYYYDESKILLSGMPRYDKLQDKSKDYNKIILAPTYRANLLKLNSDVNGTRPYDSEFKKSEYFKFYNSLINDEKLNDALQKYNTVIEFYVHPNFAAQISDFTVNDNVILGSYPYNYSKIFAEGKLLVTDYSSVAFDFAYLRKPVIYTQFDEATFFDNHSYNKGYFDYKRDGFGPVLESYNQTVDEIITLLESSIRLDAQYRSRIDEFFVYDDRNNSSRVYDAIESLKDTV